jgi:hypothetical protein
MPSYQSLRRKLAQEIGPFGAFTASNALASTTYAECAGAFDSTELPSSAFAYEWFLRTGSTNVAQRRIKKDGLNSGAGRITFDGPLDTAIEFGTTFELFGRLPATTSQTAGGTAVVMGLLECLNEALRHILVKDIVSLTITSGTYDFLLPTWLDSADRLLEIREPNALGTGRTRVWRPWRLDEQVDGNILHFDSPWHFSSGTSSLELHVLRPASTRIQVAGNWTDSTVGLANDSDVCGSDENAIVTVAKVAAYRTLRETRTGADRKRYAELYVAQVQEARRVYLYDHRNDIDPSVPQAAPQAAGTAA